VTARFKQAEPLRVGVLLAGGDGKRMGVDKRLLTLGGSTLLRRGCEFLQASFPTVAVSVGVGQELDIGDLLGVELLPDAFPGASPLAGLASALQRFGRPVFALAADIAFPSQTAVEKLADAFHDVDVALPIVDDKLEPLFAVYGPACLAPMRRLLARGRQRIVEFFPDVRVVTVPFPSAQPFFNINTMDDYAQAQRLVVDAPGSEAARGLPDDRPAAPRPALVAVVGKSDSGKTTLIEALLPELKRLGLRVGTVKHDAHDFEIDHAGKDSWRHGQAGADAYVISGPHRLAYVRTSETETPLPEIAQRFFVDLDVVVAEGYKRSAPHKVEVFRRAAGHKEPLCAPNEALALVTDADLPHEHRFDLDDARGLAAFLVTRLESLRTY
jgi:molybdopterin-guanine dinucleotide biosynthesis protein B/molybdopterin-guanine dinucleotide biosynthesis protein